MGAEPREDEVRDAVDFAAFDNMRKLEEQGGVRASGVRLVPGRHGDKNTYKVRRAKVGGYRDYFDEETQRALEARVVDALGPAFGYAGSGPEPASSAEGSADQSAGDGAERTTR